MSRNILCIGRRNRGKLREDTTIRVIPGSYTLHGTRSIPYGIGDIDTQGQDNRHPCIHCISVLRRPSGFIRIHSHNADSDSRVVVYQCCRTPSSCAACSCVFQVSPRLVPIVTVEAAA